MYLLIISASMSGNATKMFHVKQKKDVKQIDFLTELNLQAERVHSDLIEAKAILKTTSEHEAAYQVGRIEELVKWYESLEALIDKVITRRAEDRKKILTELRNEREDAEK